MQVTIVLPHKERLNIWKYFVPEEVNNVLPITARALQKKKKRYIYINLSSECFVSSPKKQREIIKTSK